MWWYTAALCALFVIGQVSSRHNELSVTLQTRWSDTSILSEASEYVAEESLGSFWKLVDSLEPLIVSFKPTERRFDSTAYLKLEEKVLKSLGRSSDQLDGMTAERQLFRLFSSSRVYSPAVKMDEESAVTVASQLFNCSHQDINIHLFQCLGKGTTWAQVGDRALCDLDEVKRTLNSLDASQTDATLLPREKVHKPRGSTTPNIPLIIVYGDLNSKDFYTWHRHLKSMSEADKCIYAFRHYTKDLTKEKANLVGYGVELALKSTEYKAVDDTEVEAKTDDSATTAAVNDSVPDDTIVQGFNFSQLYELHPELGSNLRAFQQHLFNTDDELRPLKVWQFRDLGLLASQVVLDSARRFENQTNSVEVPPGLSVLRDISQNLPVRAARIVSLKVDSNFRKDVTQTQYSLANAGIQAGQSVFFLNGMMLSTSIDIFALLDLVRQESALMRRLYNLGIPGDRISDLLAAAGSMGQSSTAASGPSSQLNEPSFPGLKHSLSGRFVLDLTQSPVVYVNNLESDQAYAHWPDSLHALFAPDFSGGIRRLRKNLYTIVLVLDPGNSDCWQMVRLAESYLLHKTAVRFGFIWSIDPSVNSPSLDLARIFAYISSVVTGPNDSPMPTSVPGLGSPGPMAALSFLTEIYVQFTDEPAKLTSQFIRSRFEKLFPDAYAEDVFGMEPKTGEYDSQLVQQHQFLKRSGLKTIATGPLMLFNGIIFNEDGIRRMGGFEDAVVNLCMEEMVHVQHAVYHGQMPLTGSISDLYNKPGTMVTRFNPRILSTQAGQESESVRYLEFGLMPIGETASPANSEPTVSELLTAFTNQMRYLQKGDIEAALRPITVWVVLGDLDDLVNPKLEQKDKERLLDDFILLKAAITHLRSGQASKGVRFGFIHNPSTDRIKSTATSKEAWITRALHLVGQPVRIPKVSSDNATKYCEQMPARNFVNRFVKEAIDKLNRTEKTSATFSSLEDLLVSGISFEALEEAIQSIDRVAFLERHATFARRVLGLKPGQRAIVVNGRVLGPLESDEQFTVEDFRLVERTTLDMGVELLASTLLDLVGSNVGGPEAVSELTWRVASVFRPRKEESSNQMTDIYAVEGIMSRTRVALHDLKSSTVGFRIAATQSGPPVFDIRAIVNPASREAQRLSHILVVLQQALTCKIEVIMNPLQMLSELPIKNFYRFVWEASPFAFETSTTTSVASTVDPVIPRALFENLPGQPLLTLGMDAPHGWMVEAVEAVHDLDNLRLADVPSGRVEAVFELEHLLLEGHCFEEGSMKPPRGLQLTLGPASDLGRYDTIVMANLGYFQLKAGPGVWHLNLRWGRSKELYTIINNDATGSERNTSETLTYISTFRSQIITVRVAKRPDMADESLLDDLATSPTKGGGMGSSIGSWDWLLKNSAVLTTLSDYAESFCPSWFTSLRKSMQKHLPWQTCSHKEETINVFSLASGHLYERLLRIMMLTVIRNTKSPVKFWFLKNYLSPTFKEFIPQMAAEYGFEYELVHYQWPRWLHAQTEKQRIIWGYKILFLDVLFPLNVTKIIYVDADQIVRADLQELADLDLQGAPYGYTPFCDSRTEMDGFRFWKQGYWANYLAGRPYHISALYVVDLTRFRQLAAGDRLRGQYHGLSQDPNSLSNLDQDLPNNMIHQVPIKSLPQEWLWCETWCSDESKSRAKTIDLCNNPQTKEPKLSGAMRIAPEWVGYDREIKRLWQRIYPSSKPHSSSTKDASKTTTATITTTATTTTTPATVTEKPVSTAKEEQKSEL